MKKSMKKPITKILACGLCLAMLAGCSSKEAGTGKENKTGKNESSVNYSGQSSELIAQLKTKYAEASDMEFANPMYNLEKDHVFEFTNLPDEFFENNEYDCFEVYWDSKLENKVDITVEYDVDNNTAVVKPNLLFSYEMPEDGSCVNDGTWGTRSKFWLVQKVDTQTGKVLDKPIVTVFTIAQDLDTPTMTQGIGENGYYKLSWTEVEGADYYEVYEYYEGGNDYASLEVTTTNTSCDYSEFKTTIDSDKRFKETYGDTEIDVNDQWLMNSKLDIVDGYFVVAKTNDGKCSGMSNECIVNDISNQIPEKVSDDFQREYEGDSSLVLPAYVEVKMLDDSIGKFLIDYHGAKAALFDDGRIMLEVKIKNLPISMHCIYLSGMDYDIFMEDVKKVTEREDELAGKSVTSEEEINIPYVPQKDLDTPGEDETTEPKEDETKDNPGEDETTESKEDETADNPEEDETTEAKEDETADNPEEDETTEAKEDETTDNPGEDETTEPKEEEPKNNPENIDISKEIADTVYGNTALSEWIALNMLSHNEKIALNEFPESSDTERLLDALLEAYTQNPLCGIMKSVEYDYKSNSLVVDYVLSKEETADMQKASLEKAEEIAAEIIKDGMSDYEKEEAINQYLCKNAEYNDEIMDYINDNGTISNEAVYKFSNSFTPYGILVENLGVCESYAEAFLLIAKEAGLEAVITTGRMGGVNHEWNRVKIDENWYTLDTTNNDCEFLPNCYFNLSDEVAGTILMEDKDAFIDQYVINYKAADMKNEYYTKNNLYTEDEAEAVSMLTKLISENDVAAIRMNQDCAESIVDGIIKEVVGNAKLTSGKYYYNAGVISIVKK